MKKPTTKRSGKRQQIIVLMDGAGNYYELPRAMLERSRVTESRKKKVAAALEDVQVEHCYIKAAAIPGSTVAAKFVEGLKLRYAGFYVRSVKAKR
jgi:SH3-like domain-containing protein